MASYLTSITNFFGSLPARAMKLIDSVIPPEKRAEIISKLQSFALANPKLSAFFLANIVLTGPPLLLFLLFSLTVFIFSLITALLIGLLAAVLFTLFCLGVALFFVLPTIFMTTFFACSIFLWGLGGYYLLKYFNDGESPAEAGTAIGDKLNSLTGGRMSWLMDAARKDPKELASAASEKAGLDGAPGAEEGKKQVEKATDGAGEGKKKAESATDGAKKHAGDGPPKLKEVGGSAKSGANGAAGKG